jgi:hypothetical protein
MPVTIEDLDRRVAALELAQSARSENALVRLEQKVDAIPRAVAELVAASEQRTQAEIGRLDDRIGVTERRFTDLLNERFDAIMTALDRLANPPKD